MKKTSLFLVGCLTEVVLLLLSPSCGKSADEPIPTPPAEGKVVQVGTELTGATECFSRWFYFSFETGETVGVGAATAEADAAWKVRADWDIAFHAGDVRTNSGASGLGQGGVCPTGMTLFDQVQEAPAEGYTVDTEGQIMASMPPTYLTCGLNAAFVWTVQEGMNYVVVPEVFVVRTAAGKYVKVLLSAIKDNRGITGVITMEYSFL
jgi:hypothetical protein